jgi:Reverse transcriptase (RNA-dependent DNA polymerase)/Endonuclease-reverse transcriptase
MDLKIAQYNVHKRKDIMILLSAHQDTAKYDILAIQEPAKNPTMHATYCDPKSAFRPLYPTNRHTRACFLVNKRLPLAHWTVEFPGPDVAILTLRLPGRTVTVTNIYSQPRPMDQTDGESPIYGLAGILQREGEHVLLGDFNLHHPLWSRDTETRTSQMALNLLAITGKANLELITPPGLVTWRRSATSHSQSTIDLTFLSETLSQHLVSCQVDNSIHHGSDHLPIATQLSLPLTGPLLLPGPKKLWKQMDREAVRAGSELLWIPTSFTSREQIDGYATYLQQFSLELADLTVPTSKPRPDTSAPRCSWWSEEISEVVREERRALRQGLPQEQLKAIGRRKKKAIRDSKRADWRRAVHEAKDSTKGIWGLVRWAKERSHLPPELPTVPPLAKSDSENGRAETFLDKVKVFHRQFFPPEPDADLSDIQHYAYPTEREQPPQISLDMVRSALRNTAPFKAPGVDGIPTGFLQAMGDPFLRAVQSLTQASWDWQHVPIAFRIARTVALRKPRKKDYSLAKAWRPIALLNTIGKIMEAVTARYLQDLAEKYDLLPEMQMGARKKRSTETALDLLLAQIRAVWDAGGVATVLSMDMSGAFDHVVRNRLVHILRQKGIPDSIVGWVKSFMSDRRTTLVFDGQESAPLDIAAGIPQGSPISPILFLFYNSELLEICNPRDMRVIGLGFVDDVNLLTWGLTTKGNCSNLEQTHTRCLRWAEKHGAKFAPEKYELIHLTRSPRRFDTTQTLRLGDVVKVPTDKVRVLGLHLDPKLQWSAHRTETLAKLETQVNALTRLSGSTWGLPMIQARHVYTSVIRPAIAYAAHTWHQPMAEKGQGVRLTRELQRIQNKCLRVITGAYKATPISSLETLACVPPLDLYLTGRVAAYRRRAELNGIDALISQTCGRIKKTLRGPRSSNIPADNRHPHPVRERWIEDWMDQGSMQGSNDGRTDGREKPAQDKKKNWLALKARWVERWRSAPRSSTEALQQPPDEGVMALHKGLHKAESSILTQLRTGKIGLASFLFKAKVPGVDSEACRCGYRQETPQHITISCPRYQDTRDSLRINGRLDFKELLSTAEGVRKVTRWWLKRGILEQFRLAAELIR